MRAVAGKATARIIAKLFICAGLVALIWLVFGQTLGHDFVNYDDPSYVSANPKIIQGLGNVARAFTEVHARNWHPLTTASHMLDCQLFGLRAGGHHFTNVLLHTATALLLFFVLRQMTGAAWRSAFVAAVFAIHPLRVESVAWIAERKDVLSGFFFVLTLWAYLRYVRAPSLARYALLALAFACGLMAKPMLVTLPLILLLLDFWPLRRLTNLASARALVLEKIPLFALAGAAALVTFFVQKTGGAQSEALPFAWRIANAFFAILDLPAANALARRAGAFLSASGEPPRALGDRARGRSCARDHDAGCAAPPSESVSPHGLVLVPDHARAGDRPGASRRARLGRSLHLFAADWPSHPRDLADLRPHGRLAAATTPPDFRRLNRSRRLERGGVPADGVLAE